MRDSSKLAADEIIIRLNGLRNTNHASKISYDLFKAMGKIYERKYQKDFQASLEVLNPVIQIMDSVFDELNNKQKEMKKSVQNSFMKAHSESTYLEYLGQLPKPEMEKSLQMLSSFSNPKFSSMTELMLETSKEIGKQSIFEFNSHSYSDVLYTLSAAKRKIERLLDWTFCSIDRSDFPLIRKYCDQKINHLNMNIDQSSLVTRFDPNNVNLTYSINKKLKNFSDNNNWIINQNLSLLIKNNSKKNDVLYLDTKLVPDANNLEKVLLVPKFFKNEKITAKKLARKMNVRPRMALYYLDAAEMLGFVERKGNSFVSTKLAMKLDKYGNQDKIQIIEQMIHELPVIKAFFLYLETISKTRFTTNDVAKFLEYSTNLSQSTAKRRASTIYSWLKTKKLSDNVNTKNYFKENSVQTYLSEFMKNAIKNYKSV